MWLFTEIGFFSAVEDRDDDNYLLVRARVQSDLAALRTLLPSRPSILTTPQADYPFRVRVGKMEFADAVFRLAWEVNYDNFKGRVGETDPGRARVYESVWAALRGRLR